MLTPYQKAQIVAKKENATIQKIKKDKYSLYSEESGWIGTISYERSQGVFNKYTESGGDMFLKSELA